MKKFMKVCFENLCFDNNFKEFLANPSVERKLDKLWSMLRSFNQGSTSEKLKRMWIEEWEEKLRVKKAAFVKLNAHYIKNPYK